MRRTTGFRVVATLGLSVLPMSLGCRGTGRLAEYDFTDRTLAVAYDSPPHPGVLTGPYFADLTDNPLHALLRIGSAVAKEIEAASVRPRLDSAVARVPVVDRMAARTLERAARHLRARPIEDERGADFVLEVRLRDYGIDAKEWNAAAHFFVDADVYLVGGRDGIQIWKLRVKEREPISPMIFGLGTVVRDVVTAASLSALSVEEIARALERLADFSADVVTNHLRDALEKVQRR